MKYSLYIDIILPRRKVIKLFDNPENLFKWQEGLLSYEKLTETTDKVGSTAKLRYNMNGREIEMIETVTKYNLPDEFSGTYETDGMRNDQHNYFSELDDQTTRWRSESEFKGTNLMMKVMTVVIPGAFKKQTYKFMVAFKKFAESAAQEV